MATRKNLRHRRQQRKIEADQRQAARDKRSAWDQMMLLRSRGVTTGKEWDRLAERHRKEQTSCPTKS